MTNEKRILIVEDNVKMATAIRRGLQQHGFECDICHEGVGVLRLVESTHYTLIILDLMLPDLDGNRVCKQLRGNGVETPILMLTALGTTDDKVKGLSEGADDYLTKPFEFDELVARIGALTRRRATFSSSCIRFEDLELDRFSRVARHGDRSLQLSNREFALLVFFLEHSNEVLSRGLLYEHIWEMPFQPETNVIDVYVKNLRRHLEHLRLRPLIHTVRGVGYIFGNAVI